MSLFATVQISCLIAFAVLLLLAAWQDWRTMQIADGISQYGKRFGLERMAATLGRRAAGR